MADRTCTYEDCNVPPIARGYCAPHYARERKAGRLRPLPQVPHEDLFWSKVNKDDDPNGCWVWMGYRKVAGYGVFSRNRTGKKFCHRHAWELLRGPIPEGYEVDHLCRNTSCVNPDHLEPVTPAENRRRAVPFRDPAKYRKPRTKPRKSPPLKPTCGKGHPFDEANTGSIGPNRRRCRTCHRDNERERLQRIREGLSDRIERTTGDAA